MQIRSILRIAACLLRIRRLLPLLLLLPALAPAHAAFERWAVIGTGKGEEAALCDLLTAELSQVPGLALVEREALQQLTDEQLLSNALSADGVASRLRLGAMLHADALLVLRITGDGEARTLTAMVIDCPTGTRLRIEQFPWKKENVPALSSHFRDLVVDLRRQYADGIKKIVGVPSFVSRSFSRDYEPLQEAYSLLLQQVLMLEPGVAVIDTSEAQAIGRELAFAGGKTIERILPLLVQGEFRVETPAGAAPTVTLSVKLTDKTGVIATADSGLLALEKAPEWITTTLPARIQAGEKNATPLSRSMQALLLNERAEVFARLGSFDQSIPLRESAVLLYPDPPKARPALVDEYFRIYYDALNPNRSALYYNYLRSRNEKTGVVQAPDFDSTVTDMVSGYIRSLDHMEYVFLRRQIGPTAIDSMLETLLLYSYRLKSIRLERAPLAVRHPIAQQQLGKADQARQRFLLSIIPVVMTYPEHTSATLDREYDARILSIHHKISAFACIGIAQGGISREDLPFIRQAAEAMPTGYSPLRISDYYADRHYYSPDFTEIQYLTFLNDLTESNHPIVRAFAKYRLLERRFQQVKGDTDQLSVLLDDIRAFGMELKSIPATYRTMRNHSILIFNLQLNVENTLARFNAPPPPPPVAQQKISAVIFDKFNLLDRYAADPLKRFQGMHLIPCQGYDIVWYADGRLYFHRTPGILEPIPPPAGMGATPLVDVVWDEQVLWLMTVNGELRLLDMGGMHLETVSNADGLLPYHEGKLFPIAPGRVLAVGVSAKDQRAWCATITWDAGARRAEVMVFHEAVENPITTDNFFKSKYARNPKLAFHRFHIFMLDGIIPSDDPIVGISRILVQQNKRWYLDPLTVNLNTLQIGIWTVQTGLQELTYYQPVMLTDEGDLLGFDDDHRPSTRLMAVTPAKTPKYRPIEVTNPGPAGPHGVGYPDQWDPQHIYLRDLSFEKISVLVAGNDGWIYLTGAKWWRIDPKALTAQRLTTYALPNQYGKLQCAASSLLGLIGWNDTECYRITIDETKIPKTGD